MMALLEVKNLKKHYTVHNGVLHAVDGVTFSIPRQQTLGVVGESGCGKSTLGKTILHMTNPTSGQILFDGKDITKVRKKELKALQTEMQMIFQDPYSSLDPRMSIAQLIAEPLTIHNIGSGKAERNEIVSEIMGMVGLASRFADSYPHELDGGRRQRVGIARALALNPRFIVCDEPVSALDVSIQAQIINLLVDLQADKDLTYMFITHDLSVVRYISNEVCVMYLGKVVEKCETEELFNHTLHPYSQALLDSILLPVVHDVEREASLQGELTSPINPKPCCRFAPRCKYATAECFEVEPALSDVGNNHLVACLKVARESVESNVSQRQEEPLE